MDNYNAYLVLSILLSILGGAGLSYILYRNYLKNNIGKLWNVILFIIRTISISLIILLLLNPQIKSNFIRNIKPVIYVAYDNSKSVKNLTDSTTLSNNLNLLDSKFNRLKSKFKIKKVLFDSDVKPYNKLTFSGNATNFSRLLSKISSEDSKNIAGVVIISDGNYNVGQNPIYSSTSLPFPVYPLVVGDTSPKINLFISNVQYNETGFLNEKQPFSIEFQAKNNTKDTVVNIKLYEGNKLIKSVPYLIKAKKRRAIINVDYLPKNIGWKSIKLQINSDINSRYNCNLFIKKNRQKILILYSDVSPDIGLIHRAINTDVRFSVKISKASDFKGKLADYSAIVFHNIPSGNFSDDRWFVNALKQKIPYWLIIGYKTDINQLNNLLSWLKIKQIKKEFDDVKCTVNDSFDDFKLNQDLKPLITSLSPIHSPSGRISINSNAHILFKQSILGVSTDRPAWVFMENPFRASVTIGEGFWKWQPYSYLKLSSIEPLYDLVLQTLRYLSIKEPQKRLFLMHKSIYKSSEPISIKAKWINSNLIADNSDPLTLIVSDSLNRKLYFNMIPDKVFYKADIGFLDSGLYKTSISRNFNDTIFVDSGRFIVSNTNIENNAKQANVYLMHQLTNNGIVYRFNSVNKLIDDVSNKNTIKIIRKNNSIISYLINNQFLMYLIISLLFLEWIIRKTRGYI